MAGTIIADKIQTENSFLTLNVGQTLVATINSSGILNSSGGTMIGANGSVSNTAITGVITASQLATSLNLATKNVQVASIQTATGTPAITFAANGQITTANAGLVLTGGQIQFPASQIASADGNCLDDYEEGTWTPVATSGGGSITTYSSNGVYTKIGRTVTIFGSITTTTVGTASGTLNFSGLPFATLNSEQYVGLSREAINTGANHFAVISTSSGYLQSNTGGGITWSNGNSYRFTVTYQAT